MEWVKETLVQKLDHEKNDVANYEGFIG